ncbi:ATP-binding protein [Flavobacterium sp.]|uniref:AAA family ATPase n=1 Tax=Flavobacterium sp. TaxID=239 RepID=UPI00286D76B0|nr:ATP-binding protein [Flavobacterium sp.]
MLLEFTVGNFLSFKDKKTFSLEAGGISELKNNVVKEGKYNVLRSAVIYGANSSGKSNFISALDFMVNTIKNSSKLNSTDKLNAKPFLLSTETENKPSFFEILLTDLNKRYRYGFEVDNNKVISEWLYVLNDNSKKEIIYFTRSIDGIGVADIFDEAKGLENKTRDNGLFLPLVDQFNSDVAKTIMQNISNLYVRSGLEHRDSVFATNMMCDNDKDREILNTFIRKLDLGFENFSLENIEGLAFGNRIKTLHNVYDSKGSVISNYEFKLSDQESSGTNKIFDLSGFVLLSIQLGLVLIIDELDSKLHPILTQEIIKLFNNPETNPKNAQLIFTTHDTNLLGANLFRRDQIWFTEKDEFEATDMYSLLEFKDEDGKTIRKDRSFEADYIRGRYGAIPYISNFEGV